MLKCYNAMTTPVIEEQARWAYRSNREIDDYNRRLGLK